MSVLVPRSRMVYFRVTDEEYRYLKAICANRGERSLSHLIRSIVTDKLFATRAERFDDLTGILSELSKLLRERGLAQNSPLEQDEEAKPRPALGAKPTL